MTKTALQPTGKDKTDSTIQEDRIKVNLRRKQRAWCTPLFRMSESYGLSLSTGLQVLYKIIFRNFLSDSKFLLQSVWKTDMLIVGVTKYVKGAAREDYINNCTRIIRTLKIEIGNTFCRFILYRTST